MRNELTRQIIHLIVMMIGVCLMIGGIMTGKHGASVIGLIVASVNTQQWIQWSKKRKQ